MVRQIKTKPVSGEPKLQPGDNVGDTKGAKRVSLSAALGTKSSYATFDTWLIGLSPLIVHSWSHKAKLEMLQKQVKAVKGKGRATRDPDQDFVDSLYQMGKKDGKPFYGFPTTGLKKAILAAAHKDKGLARSSVLSSLWLDSQMVAVKTAFAGARCDLPLSRIYGSAPIMREDMVKIGAGLNKTANLAYRAQFDIWAIRVRGRFNLAAMTDEQLAFLMDDSGLASGIGEWRNEKGGVFGAYKLANAEEETEWDEFAEGNGPMPQKMLAIGG